MNLLARLPLIECFIEACEKLKVIVEFNGLCNIETLEAENTANEYFGLYSALQTIRQ